MKLPASQASVTPSIPSPRTPDRDKTPSQKRPEQLNSASAASSPAAVKPQDQRNGKPLVTDGDAKSELAAARAIYPVIGAPGGPVHALSQRSRSELARLARQSGIAGWHDMRKADLLRVLLARGIVQWDTPANGGSAGRSGGATSERSAVAAGFKGLSSPRQDVPIGPAVDRLLATACDPHWLHIAWELTPATIQRAEAALGPAWYAAVPKLRLMDVTVDDAACAAETLTREVVIAPKVSSWYLQVEGAPKSYRVDLGYGVPGGRFYAVARSNVVAMPKAWLTRPVDAIGQRLESMESAPFSGLFRDDDAATSTTQDHGRTPAGRRSLASTCAPPADGVVESSLPFQIDAELIIHGQTQRGARVYVHNEPVALRPDGAFTLRLYLAEGRQIIPACAQTPDGRDTQTIILAVERNTKRLGPVSIDDED